MTPLVGVPAILARCIEQCTPHSCRAVQERNTYEGGPIFDSDILWKQSPELAEQELREADLFIVHNGNYETRHKPLLDSKPVVTMSHMPEANDVFVRRGFPGLVVGQYQSTLKYYRRWGKVPNPMPFWESEYRPEPKPGVVTICYTPAAKHERYPPEHCYFWHAKGYFTTMKILERLERRYPIHLEVIRDAQISHPEALAMKRRAHIVIDECVTGSYHRNSLEGLAAGCIVINGMGLLEGVPEAFRYCAGYAPTTPFVFASLETLERVLSDLIETGPGVLEESGRRNRRWIERHWDFRGQWERFWDPAVRRALGSLPAKAGQAG